MQGHDGPFESTLGSQGAWLRIYILTLREVTEALDVVTNILPFCGQNLNVFFDSRVLNSFIEKHILSMLEI